MIIGIDGNEANIGKRVGIGRYVYELLTHIYENRNFNKTVNFRVYLKAKVCADMPRETSWWKYEIFGPGKFWTQVALPYHLFIDNKRPNIFFTPSHYAPRFSPCPAAISIMDLSYIHYPELFLKKDLHQLRSWTAYSVKKSVRIFTISKFSKKEIIKYYNLPDEKVIVTYPGYDCKKFYVQNMDDVSSVKKTKMKFNILDDYILFVGTLQPRKNILRLIDAFNLIIRRYNMGNTQLIIVGKRGWLYDEVFANIKKNYLETKVIFVEYIPDNELRCLYKGAKCFVLPSLYEGFGLPAIEAMACGCPVVVSNVSSLPEVVGEAGILIDPLKVEDIAGSIYKLLTNEAKRRLLIKRGFARIKLFSWDNCAKKTLETLEEVVS